MSKRIGTLLLAVLGLAALPLLGQESPFVVVVHASNPVSSISKAKLSKLFLKKAGKWESGLRVVPVDQAPSRAVRSAFTSAVHGKSIASIKGYWQKMIFSGRATPPTEVESDREVLALVRQNSGGVGYVTVGATLGNELKKVKVDE